MDDEAENLLIAPITGDTPADDQDLPRLLRQLRTDDLLFGGRRHRDKSTSAENRHADFLSEPDFEKDLLAQKYTLFANTIAIGINDERAGNRLVGHDESSSEDSSASSQSGSEGGSVSSSSMDDEEFDAVFLQQLRDVVKVNSARREKDCAASESVIKLDLPQPLRPKTSNSSKRSILEDLGLSAGCVTVQDDTTSKRSTANSAAQLEQQQENRPTSHASSDDRGDRSKIGDGRSLSQGHPRSCNFTDTKPIGSKKEKLGREQQTSSRSRGSQKSASSVDRPRQSVPKPTAWTKAEQVPSDEGRKKGTQDTTTRPTTAPVTRGDRSPKPNLTAQGQMKQQSSGATTPVKMKTTLVPSAAFASPSSFKPRARTTMLNKTSTSTSSSAAAKEGKNEHDSRFSKSKVRGQIPQESKSLLAPVLGSSSSAALTNSSISSSVPQNSFNRGDLDLQLKQKQLLDTATEVKKAKEALKEAKLKYESRPGGDGVAVKRMLQVYERMQSRLTRLEKRVVRGKPGANADAAAAATSSSTGAIPAKARSVGPSIGLATSGSMISVGATVEPEKTTHARPAASSSEHHRRVEQFNRSRSPRVLLPAPVERRKSAIAVLSPAAVETRAEATQEVVEDKSSRSTTVRRRFISESNRQTSPRVVTRLSSTPIGHDQTRENDAVKTRTDEKAQDRAVTSVLRPATEQRSVTPPVARLGVTTKSRPAPKSPPKIGFGRSVSPRANPSVTRTSPRLPVPRKVVEQHVQQTSNGVVAATHHHHQELKVPVVKDKTQQVVNSTVAALNSNRNSHLPSTSPTVVASSSSSTSGNNNARSGDPPAVVVVHQHQPKAKQPVPRQLDESGKGETTQTDLENDEAAYIQSLFHCKNGDNKDGRFISAAGRAGSASTSSGFPYNSATRAGSSFGFLGPAGVNMKKQHFVRPTASSIAREMSVAKAREEKKERLQTAAQEVEQKAGIVVSVGGPAGSAVVERNKHVLGNKMSSSSTRPLRGRVNKKTSQQPLLFSQDHGEAGDQEEDADFYRPTTLAQEEENAASSSLQATVEPSVVERVGELGEKVLESVVLAASTTEGVIEGATVAPAASIAPPLGSSSKDNREPTAAESSSSRAKNGNQKSVETRPQELAAPASTSAVEQQVSAASSTSAFEPALSAPPLDLLSRVAELPTDEENEELDALFRKVLQTVLTESNQNSPANRTRSLLEKNGGVISTSSAGRPARKMNAGNNTTGFQFKLNQDAVDKKISTFIEKTIDEDATLVDRIVNSKEMSRSKSNPVTIFDQIEELGASPAEREENDDRHQEVLQMELHPFFNSFSPELDTTEAIWIAEQLCDLSAKTTKCLHSLAISAHRDRGNNFDHTMSTASAAGDLRNAKMNKYGNSSGSLARSVLECCSCGTESAGTLHTICTNLLQNAEQTLPLLEQQAELYNSEIVSPSTQLSKPLIGNILYITFLPICRLHDVLTTLRKIIVTYYTAAPTFSLELLEDLKQNARTVEKYENQAIRSYNRLNNAFVDENDRKAVRMAALVCWQTFQGGNFLSSEYQMGVAAMSSSHTVNKPVPIDMGPQYPLYQSSSVPAIIDKVGDMRFGIDPLHLPMWKNLIVPNFHARTNLFANILEKHHDSDHKEHPGPLLTPKIGENFDPLAISPLRKIDGTNDSNYMMKFVRSPDVAKKISDIQALDLRKASVDLAQQRLWAEKVKKNKFLKYQSPAHETVKLPGLDKLSLPGSPPVIGLKANPWPPRDFAAYEAMQNRVKLAPKSKAKPKAKAASSGASSYQKPQARPYSQHAAKVPEKAADLWDSLREKHA
ncbi:unnamed protein product [Amoebophrya sp. A120]|nr:unnamed protein product [Amoebophrya sp. A120]|eukprot:GSA120T00012346001.1